MQLWNGSSRHSQAVIHPVKKRPFSLAALWDGKWESGAQSRAWIIHGPSSKFLCVPFWSLCLHLKGNVGWGLSGCEATGYPRGAGGLGRQPHPWVLAFLQYVYLPALVLSRAETRNWKVILPCELKGSPCLHHPLSISPSFHCRQACPHWLVTFMPESEWWCILWGDINEVMTHFN